MVVEALERLKQRLVLRSQQVAHDLDKKDGETALAWVRASARIATAVSKADRGPSLTVESWGLPDSEESIGFGTDGDIDVAATEVGISEYVETH